MRRRRAQTPVQLGLALATLAVAVALVALGREPPHAQAADLGYARTIAWHVDGVPELAPMEATIRDVLGRIHVTFKGMDGQAIDGFLAGAVYAGNLYIRDAATDLPTVRYYYDAAAVRSTIEEFLRQQYPDGSISAIVNPDFRLDKATTVSDEETSAIIDAVEAYDTLPDPAWLGQPVHGQPLIERLNRAMDWLLDQRRDDQTGLIKRAHTTDWGDVKWEPSPDPTHMQPGDQWTLSIYDQAIAYAALRGLARLNAAAGRNPDRARFEAIAEDLQAATDSVLWQDDPSLGYYRIHVHLAPDHLPHTFDESQIIAIGNAAAVYYGLARPDKIGRILDALQRAQDEARAPKPGLSLQPPYPGWDEPQMGPRIYQNGALWDWWAGRQVSAEFWSGYWSTAREHLFEVARDWASHPDSVHEWDSPWTERTSVDQAYGGAASAVGQAVVDGLFGVQLLGREVRLAPRLGGLNGGIRVYEPSTDVYVAYEYQASDHGETLQYGSNSPTALAVRLPVRWQGPTQARLDAADTLPVSYQAIGQELVGTVIVPSGIHTVEFRRVPLGRPRF